MTTAMLTELAPYKAPHPTDLHTGWHGYLTTENVEHVAARIENMLGGQCFTHVSVGAYRPMEPEVHTGCRLQAEGRTSGRPVDWHREEREYGLSCGVSFSTAGWAFAFHTRLTRQPPWFWLYEPDPRMAGKADRDANGFAHGRPQDVSAYIDAVELAHWSCQVVFEDHGRTLRLTERAPVGQMWAHVFTVERELKRTRELIELAKHHELVAAADESTRRLFAGRVENAEWELDG